LALRTTALFCPPPPATPSTITAPSLFFFTPRNPRRSSHIRTVQAHTIHIHTYIYSIYETAFLFRCDHDS
jgi:hypothetical protein